MGPWARSKFGAPIFESEVFRNQLCSIEKSTVTLSGFFVTHYSDSAPGELYLPLPPVVTPLSMCSVA